MKFFIKKGVNLVIDRKLNEEWREINKEDVLPFLDSTGLVWHKNLDEDDAVFVWGDDNLIDGKCKVLSAEAIENLNEYSEIVNL